MTELDLDNPIHALAEALAWELDSEHLPFGTERLYRDWSAQVLTDDYRVYLRKSNNGKRIEISAWAAEHDSRIAISRKWPKGTVAIDRMTGLMHQVSAKKAAALAEYVRDRILKDEYLLPCIAEVKMRREAADLADKRREATLAVLIAAGARQPAHLTGEFLGKGYQGRVERDGKATFTRLGSVSPERAARIIAILDEESNQ